jgi:LacI family transcriptional regulator
MKNTIKDVAREANVSVATVSRVLNESSFVSEQIKERVFSAVAKLNYQPNAIARSLKIDKTNTIGIVVPDITNPYFMNISKGIENIVYEQGYNLIFGSADESPKKEGKLLQLLYEKRVDAIVLATSGGNEALIKNIHRAGTPIVLVDRRIDCPNNLDLIVEDNIGGAYYLTKTLIEKGHSRIGLVNGDLDTSTGMERFLGFKKALANYNIEHDDKFTYLGDFSKSEGEKAVRYFWNLNERPTAILSFNNLMTFGVLLELTRMGKHIPGDIVVASYGETEAAQLLTDSDIISLTQFPYQMGVKAGGILIDRLVNGENGPFREIFQPLLKTDVSNRTKHNV